MYCGKNGHISRFCRKRQYDLGGAQQSISLDRDKGELEKTNKSFAVLKDNAASVNELNFTSTKAVASDSPKQVCPQPKITKTQAEWTARGSVVPRRDPHENSSKNEKTKIALKFCPLKPAPELLKCNSQERQN